MAIQTYNLGIVTAYGDARAGGYTGTLEEWRELMANYATVSEQAAQSARDAQSSANLAQQRADSITNLVAVAQTLPKESSATANYADGVLTLGIPRGDGDKGDKGDKGDVGPAPTVTITRITGGHRLTITDDTGDHSCDIMDGAGSVNDVQIDGTSILTSGVAEIPIASTTTYGVIRQQTTTQQTRNINTAVFGTSAYILNGVGAELAPTVISSTEIQIADGQLIAEGYTLGIDSGTTESLTIEPGSSGMLRTDLIVARYTKNSGTGVEDMQLVVIKGTPAASNPATPTYNTGSIANGNSPVDFPIYQVNINGTSITSVDALVGTVNIPNIISDSISNALNSALKWKLIGGYVQGQTFVTVPAAAKEVYVIVYIKWTSGEKVMVDFHIPIEPYAFGSPTNFAQHVNYYGANKEGYVCIEARTTNGTNFMRLYEARNGSTDVTANSYCAYMYR